MLLICIFIMKWPPEFVSYQDYKNELINACNEHPHFEQWLAKIFYIRNNEYGKLCLRSRLSNLNIANEKFLPNVHNLKEAYWNQMNVIIQEKMLGRVVQDILVNNFAYTEEDTKAENIYNSNQKEQIEKKKLIESQGGMYNIPRFNQPERMKLKNQLLQLIDETIIDYNVTIEKIMSQKSITTNELMKLM